MFRLKPVPASLFPYNVLVIIKYSKREYSREERCLLEHAKRMELSVFSI